jgi:hypothetical protein
MLRLFLDRDCEVRTLQLTESTDLAGLDIYYNREKVTTIVHNIGLLQNTMRTDRDTDMTSLAQLGINSDVLRLPRHCQIPKREPRP